MKDSGKKISVCLLTYNHVNMIESTIQSILDQSVTGYEIIISDDCSSDGTWERILEFSSIFQQIKPVQTPYNMGMAGNANFAVSQSDRPYIALLHHDDIYRSDLLEKWSQLIEQYPGVGFIFNSYGIVGSNDIYSESITKGDIQGQRFLENFLFPRWGCPVRGTAMIRRSAWEMVGGMRCEFNLLADIDLWMRLSMRWNVAYVPEPLIFIRHDRPEYYPDIYNEKNWSWLRQRYLYEIHAANRKAYYSMLTLPGSLQWRLFRIRLNVETTKWLIYSIIMRKAHMIETLEDSVTTYDFPWLRIFRKLVFGVGQMLICRNSNPE